MRRWTGRFLLTAETGYQSGPMAAVHFDFSDGIAVLTLDNPPVNAMTRGAARQLNPLLRQCVADETVRIVVRLNKQALARTFGDEPNPPARRSVPLFEQPFGSSDGREGVRAFLAKEKPRFGVVQQYGAELQP
ncbi:hypothetical protein QMK17_10495 [Rhodococcus sp. G-MC3]|uniref:hypothetical protein n=1 Tax=Rhodococcus sp. G-MC3 TaxID=3046209 RepID=UPI0024BAE3BC|nr:hypothetical protein [Rhodococcus sp. G-MC3]MDJ0393759.1 hypothetical protein [Rhodococcus sp. G-MC3]